MTAFLQSSAQWTHRGLVSVLVERLREPFLNTNIAARDWSLSSRERWYLPPDLAGERSSLMIRSSLELAAGLHTRASRCFVYPRRLTLRSCAGINAAWFGLIWQPGSDGTL